ncbi:hypothetical protein BP6252_13545 [Coleophoma cylindrospora]|uniref:Uncharacterized protein n=1 Tax=Coleophoma cylindrospora TaxID=1849047 RepID=A0A3D8Q9K0_9HELO|nr:hypothetical protein BP6252_13545 [Coleophoma cylindrospora]
MSETTDTIDYPISRHQRAKPRRDSSGGLLFYAPRRVPTRENYQDPDLEAGFPDEPPPTRRFSMWREMRRAARGFVAYLWAWMNNSRRGL